MFKIYMLSLWLMLAGWPLSTVHGKTLYTSLSNQSSGPKPAKKDRYVTYLQYKGEQVPKHRTPAKKLKGGGAIMVRELEDLLDQGEAALIASPLEPIFTSAQRNRIALVQLQVRTARPKWNHGAYEQELNFYQREDDWRESHRLQLAREQQERELAHRQLLARKAKRATDSIARVMAYRWQLRRDSLQAIAVQVRLRKDSLEAIIRAESSPYRFVNATKLNLRDEPSANSQARAAILLGSSVEVIRRLPSGWWQVSVEGYSGYLRGEYLVSTLDGITVPEADVARLKESEGSAYVERAPVKMQAQGKRKVYICDGRYAYAYHSTSSCAGLNNCRAGVFYTIEFKAQNMGRTPCGRCFD